MKIRWKLLILLLATAWIPLIVMEGFGLRATRRTGDSLAGTLKENLTESANDELLRLVRDHSLLLSAGKKIVELIVVQQARESQLVLEGPLPSEPGQVYFFDDYGNPATEPSGMARSKIHQIPLSRSELVFKLAPGVDREGAKGQTSRLNEIRGTFKRLHEAWKGLIVWQYSCTEEGVHASYPGHAGYPEDYDGRTRVWYGIARERNALSWTQPYGDAVTGRVTLSASAPIRSTDGRFMGVTGVDLFLTDLLKVVQFPGEWGTQARTLIVDYVEDAGKRDVVVVAKQEYQTDSVDWQDLIEVESLSSPDEEGFTRLMDSMKNRETGVMRMPMYDREGRSTPALWAYGPMGEGVMGIPYLVICVPEDVVVGSATEAEELVLSTTGERIRRTIVLGIIISCAILLLAWFASRTVTRPVEALADATTRISEGEFDTRVEIVTGDELQALADAFNSMVPQLEDRMKMREALAVAMEVQQNLLPSEPPVFEGLDIAGKSIYCDETGGDYYDFLEVAPEEGQGINVVIGDVTGHGIAAALLMASARALWRSHMAGQDRPMAETITRVNRHLMLDSLQGRFMTMMCLTLDARKREVRWVGAGHDAVHVYHPEGDRFEQLEGADVPLGILPEWEYQEFKGPWPEAGTIYVVGTDGIWEAADETGEMFGMDRFRDVIRSSAALTAEGIHSAIIEEVERYRGAAPQKDDVTLVVIRFT